MSTRGIEFRSDTMVSQDAIAAEGLGFVVGLLGDALKVKLTAPPVEGAANTMVIEFLARCLGISRSAVEIRAGQTGRIKQILIRCDPADQPRLRQCIADLASDESS